MPRTILALLLLLPLLASAQALPGGADAAHAGARQLPESELDAKLARTTLPDGLEVAARRLARKGEAVEAAKVWRRLSELRPHIGRYTYEMAAELARRNYKTLAYNALLHLQGQGYAFRVQDDPRFGPVGDTEVWAHIIKGFDANRQPFGSAERRFELPREDLLIESLAWDAKRQRLLVGSARNGTVYIVEGKGRLSPLVVADAENGMWGVFDLAVDAERDVLWVASTAVPHFLRYDAERDLGGAGLFKFRLSTGTFIKRFLSPRVPGQQFFMSSLALGPDGTLYAADGVNNAIYMVRDDQLRRIAHNPLLGSIRGMAVAEDGRTLYFADYERGLFGLELATGAPFEVRVPPTLALGGIDGLVVDGNALVVVQNGMNPKRVMRLELDAGGRQVSAVKPLLANLDELVLPTMATRVGGELLLIANSQKGNYDRFGLVRDKNRIEGTVILATALRPAQDREQAGPAPSAGAD